MMMTAIRKTPLLMLSVVLLLALAVSVGSFEDKKPKDKPASPKKAGANGITWMRYDDGLKKAKAEDKHVFIDFTAKWCGWCRKMDKETFSRTEVIDMLNAHFVSVKVDGDSHTELNVDGYKITERNLARSEFGVRGYPAFWFLKSDGSKVGAIRGYRDAKFMMEAFDFVKEEKYDTTKTGGSDKEGK